MRIGRNLFLLTVKKLDGSSRCSTNQQQVKKAAKDLLEVLKRERLVLDWKKQQKTRAGVRQAIEKVLDDELPRVYTPELYGQKCDVVYQHVFESYYGQGKSLYAHSM